MAIDFGENAKTPEPVLIKGQVTEQVQSYKYLGTIIDSALNFKESCKAVSRKGHQRLFCLRKLSHIDRTTMTLFYHAFIESVLAFSLVTWFRKPPLKRKELAQPDHQMVWSADWRDTAEPGVAVHQTVAATSQLHLQ